MTPYFVEVDVEIPQELHEYLKDYPPCPEVRSVPTEWLSDYQKQILIDNTKQKEGVTHTKSEKPKKFKISSCKWNK